jgi:arylsulfatase A-like enzyme
MSMNRRDFVKTSAAATLAIGFDAKAEPAAKRKQPNVLFVFGDQHRAQSLPGETFSQVVAPTIDSFRRKNFSMNTCVSNYPLCTPYRGILMSGKWPSQSGIMFNNRVLSMESGALGHTFRDAGYSTAYVGKWHLGGHGEAPGFIPSGPGRLGFEDYWQAWDSTNLHFHAWTYHPATGEKIFPEGWQPTQMTDQAVDFIKKQNGDKPWLLVLSWNPPHPPYNPPAEDMNLYPEDSLKFRPNVKLRSMSEDAMEASRFLSTKEQLPRPCRGIMAPPPGSIRSLAACCRYWTKQDRSRTLL